MEPTERAWQATTRKVRSRLGHVLESIGEFPADVQFKVGRPGDEVETIGAHKLILAAGSEVMYAMFYGPVADKKKTIEITDLNPSAFRQMLRFLYTDRIHVDESVDYVYNVWLVFRTMECARKYDIPELYFACRSWLLEKNKRHRADERSTCTSILIGALMMSDHGLAEACYSDNNGCCPLGQLDVEMLTNEGLCQILSKKDTLWSEKELYDLSLRWAKFHCGGNATPEQLRAKLNAARFLIRYSKMTPAEISDGPAEAEIITPIETKLVFQQIFGSTKSETYPFDDQARVPYRAWDGEDVTLPIVIRDLNGSSDAPSVYQANVRIHPEASAGTFKKFRQLRNLKYPFVLSVDGQDFDKHPDYMPLAEPEALVAQLKLKKSTARYVMEGDIAFSYDEETAKLRLHVAVYPGFKPAGWILVGSLEYEDDLKFLKAAGKMRGIGLCTAVYYTPAGDDEEEEGASSEEEEASADEEEEPDED